MRMQVRMAVRVCAVAVALALAIGAVGCGVRRAEPMTAAESEAVIREVRAFAEDVARDVTKEGPVAWGRYFADTPAFFMAVDGRLEFVNGTAAKAGLPQIAQAIPHVELQWGEGMRVDPLGPGVAVMAGPYHEAQVDAAGRRTVEDGYFTGTVEQRDGRWQLRNAHWSSGGRK
jgi:hypothetical protein